MMAYFAINCDGGYACLSLVADKHIVLHDVTSGATSVL